MLVAAHPHLTFSHSPHCQKLLCCFLKHWNPTKYFQNIFVIAPQAHQSGTVKHKIERASEEESVIQLEIQRENASDDNNMGNILESTQEILFSEVQNESSDQVKSHAEQSNGKK